VFSCVFCSVQAARFRVGAHFASKQELKDSLKHLSQELKRKFRANHSNDAHRIAYQCSTVKGKKKPSGRPGACQFFVRATLDHSGCVTIKESCLAHTTCTEESNAAAMRNLITVPSSEAEAIAAAVVSSQPAGNLAEAVRDSIESKGLTASSSTIARAIAKTRFTRAESVHTTYASLAAFAEAYDAADADNFAKVELDNDRCLDRVMLVSGSAKRMQDRGLLAPVVTLGYSTVGKMDGMMHCLGSLGSSEGLLAGAATSAGLGRLVVCVGRNFAGNLVLLSVGLVSTESAENTEWFLDMTEKQLEFVKKFEVVNFLTDCSAATTTAIEAVYGSKAFGAYCYTHFRRNVVHNAPGGEKARIEVQVCLDRCFHARTALELTAALDELKRTNLASHLYVSAVDLSRWAPASLPFNPVGDVGCNDVDFVLESVLQMKRAGDVFGCIFEILCNESKKLFSLQLLFSTETGLLVSPDLRKVFEARAAQASATFVAGQSDVNVMNVATNDCPSKTYRVDLTNVADRKTWCSCGQSALETVPCVHVLAAVKEHKALNGDVVVLFPEGALRPTDGGFGVSTLLLPSTFEMVVDTTTKRPQWITEKPPKPFASSSSRSSSSSSSAQVHPVSKVEVRDKNMVYFWPRRCSIFHNDNATNRRCLRTRR